MPGHSTRTQQLTVRLPLELLAALRQAAARERVSLASALIAAALRGLTRGERKDSAAPEEKF